jgi:hypothetical protein
MVFACHFWNLLSKQSLKATLRFGTPQAPAQRKEHARTVRLAALQLRGCTEGLDLKPHGLNEAVGGPRNDEPSSKTRTMGIGLVH